LDDDEDEEELPAAPQDKKQAQASPEDKIPPQGFIRTHAESMEEEGEEEEFMSEEASNEDEEEFSEEEEMEECVPSTVPSPFLPSEMEEIVQEHRMPVTAVPVVRPSQRFLPRQLGVDARELHGRASLFEEHEQQSRGLKRTRDISPFTPSPITVSSAQVAQAAQGRQFQQPLYSYRGVGDLLDLQKKQFDAVAIATTEARTNLPQ
jgi:hypothetical protein